MTREVEILTSLKDRFEDVMEEGLLGVDTDAVDALDSNKEIVDALEVAIQALEQEPKWIPVSERLPEDGEWAIFTNGKMISVERYKMDALDHFYPSGRWFNLEDVVAWMPLPKPYEPQESEEETIFEQDKKELFDYIKSQHKSRK